MKKEKIKREITAILRLPGVTLEAIRREERMRSAGDNEPRTLEERPLQFVPDQMLLARHREMLAER